MRKLFAVFAALMAVVLGAALAPTTVGPTALAQAQSALPGVDFGGLRNVTVEWGEVVLTSGEVENPQLSPDGSELDPDREKVPVIIVHGTWSNVGEVAKLEESLRARGFTVYSYNYGRDFSLVGLLGPEMGGMADIEESTQTLADKIAEVRRLEQAAGRDPSRVDLVGHSQGGLIIKNYLNETQNDGRVVTGLESVFGKKNVAYVTSGTMFLDAIDLLPNPLRPAARWAFDRVVDVVLGVAPRQQLEGGDFINALEQDPGHGQGRGLSGDRRQGRRVRHAVPEDVPQRRAGRPRPQH
ncbi:esterase/lipase family protein [Mycolicibacterium brumae]|uniref:AB hydrolase-1 domain-containing protein n=1 Tax=Mycolicibacterium brumae TaxID=85968 RepID=A0A2G5P741_9MYCO|nr:alpha/beta fold hydrolase [Mycolicibacterium brumae]MCV7194588.1 alpha/beta fold hydrolase [Mycolicibacterium brumae]PIB74191.1 hypothetical protein CQY22_013895 [Mycolicibacterium brumae]UWW08927.1 alpha/beta fold hydrolase [Mycolicibacterium brumae]